MKTGHFFTVCDLDFEHHYDMFLVRTKFTLTMVLLTLVVTIPYTTLILSPASMSYCISLSTPFPHEGLWPLLEDLAFNHVVDVQVQVVELTAHVGLIVLCLMHVI